MDPALQLLLPRLGASGRRLWLADEHVDAVPALAPGLQAISNRCDVQALLLAGGIDCRLSDFDIGALGSEFDTVVFRVAKEKAQVHHLINAALAHLAPGGWLWLAGEKDEGIRSYIDKAAARAGSAPQLQRSGPCLLGGIQRGAELGAPLDDRGYAEWRQLALAPDLTIWSKPGIYGWQKVDAGSAFLIDQLDAVWPTPPRRVLDLGCGYGYLTLCAARRWPGAAFTATDNNIVAVEAARRNLQGLAAEVYCSDAGAGLDGGFDALLCNPPFHQGFEVDGALTGRFLAAAARLLAADGRALFVVNQFIPIERRAGEYFRRVEQVARNRSFKLVMVTR
jgi:16S rRNA (guanine1207-N2)-methyltransferase